MKKNNFLALILTTVCFSLLIISCSNEDKKSTEATTEVKAPSNEDILEHGKYLVEIMGCNDCHSPKTMGAHGPEIIPELMLSGYPSDRPIVKFDTEITKTGFSIFYPDLTASGGPWGVSFAANLTPDQSGIGAWTEEQFKNALTKGYFKGIEGGRMLLPPMPWFNYTNLTDYDVHAMYTYLKSIPPVKNIVPPPISPDEM